MIKSEKRLLQFLSTTSGQVKKLVTDIDSEYRHKTVDKTKYGVPQRDKNGKIRKRELDITHSELKRIQEQINFLLQKIPSPDYSFGSVKGRNNILNAYQHFSNKYFLTIDFKNFFRNINNRQVYSMLISENFSPDVARTLTRLVTYKGFLPQGPPSSPIVANMVFNRTGRILAKLALEHHLTFTAYMDDLVFSSKVDFKDLIPIILKTIRDAEFRPHPKKISYSKSCPEVTGVRLTEHGLYPPASLRTKAFTHFPLRHYVNSFRPFRNMTKYQATPVT
ncbi:reverse transcriptase family protein [Chitinophaga horti]|uniref:RNA-directed DNA polymerase n=1 Tax=Chitinophaga horti TaxID=2920382 RepID=A0ABY6J532_9BACT|nr:reverse transcriptase family protein [Chitinophaga horti]UYQ93404.1 reverse transcriptase family protein [Chitinophaga horti]